MSYYLQVGTEEMQPLATVSGWGDVLDWAATLPMDKCSCIVHLGRYGWEQDLQQLEAELTTVLKDSPPTKADVRSTVEGLLKMVKARPQDAEVITVTDGMGPGGTEDGE